MSTEQGKILQFSELKVINVQELTVNTRKIQAGLIAPAKETVAVWQHDEQLDAVEQSAQR